MAIAEPCPEMTNPLKRNHEGKEVVSVVKGQCLEAKGSKPEEFEPRSYQIDILKVAMKRNTIAVLDTGSGKTMIAVMLMKEIGQVLKSGEDKGLMIFLAPTVHLVTQQCEVIKIHTNFRVMDYHGAKGIDEWNKQCWDREINSQEVMVMTPQILLDALRNAFVTLDIVKLIIFDECHHAKGNHPYTKIMTEFYHKPANKPKVFGMTASPVIRKGVTSIDDCEEQISELERILYSQVYTVEDRDVVEVFVPLPKESNVYYDPFVCPYEDLKIKLDTLWQKFNALLSLKQSEQINYKDTEEIYGNLKKKTWKCHDKIMHCLDNLGPACAYEAAKFCMEKIGLLNELERSIFPALGLCKSYLDEVFHTLKEIVPPDIGNWFEREEGLALAVQKGYISPKLCKLVRVICLLGTSKLFHCLIFVERIIAAKVLACFVSKMSLLSEFTSSYLTGDTSSSDALAPKVQKQTLDLFRSGKVNLLFTTDVAEEGMDLHICSSVIRFDLPKTIRSYIQSRGRARHTDSHYVLMLERDNIKDRDALFDLIRSVQSMRDTTLSRDSAIDNCIPIVSHLDEAYFYSVPSTGATVTLDSSINLLYKYCDKLPGDKYYTPRPAFQYTLVGKFYQCTLTLPPNAAFHMLKGPVNRNSHVSRQLACLEACQKLHKIGALDDHLLPIIEEPEENDLVGETIRSSLGAGTTRRKELHGTAQVHAISGTWSHEVDDVTFHAYKVSFSSNTIGEQYSGFVLLMGTLLDNDVANTKINLNLKSNKVVESCIFSCGEINLNADQVRKSKLFHEMFYNALYRKLFQMLKNLNGVEKQKEGLLENGNMQLWTTSNMYLLLPLIIAPHDHEAVSIDWEGVNACATMMNFWKNTSLPIGKCGFFGAMQSWSFFSTTCEDEHMMSRIFQLANGAFPISDLKHRVVLSVHTGRVYCIMDMIHNTMADSPFEEDATSQYSSYADYFKKKYNIELKYPGQPLFLLKQSHNPHNLLLAGSFEKSGPEDDVKMPVNGPQGFIRMPPELLVNLSLSGDVLKSFYLLPSLMHRMESLMLACQLRKEITCQIGDHNVSSALMLEAITSKRCSENFSLERLELLGDSVLKYAVSCKLFLKYPEKHEGQLSACRSRAVCNATLHKLATNHKLQNYIRDAPFDPLRWVAPGQCIALPVPCKCGLDTRDVPLDSQYVTQSTATKVGCACDRGHRWMCSKTIADCLEALIGAYFLGGSLKAAISFMNLMGIDCEYDATLVEEAANSASLRCYIPKSEDLELLETKIGYTFLVKALLVESITHASRQEFGAGFCYQRLEFLGDSLLDLLTTRYLFEKHRDIDPGVLTDLRSASVNNENFAQIAVKHDLQPHLLHASGLLLGQITEYVQRVKDYHDSKCQDLSLTRSKCPKVLGDLLESIAGAILIDSGFNLETVWRLLEPILSPFVTPCNLPLPPVRELYELCDSKGFTRRVEYAEKDLSIVATVGIQLRDARLVRTGVERKKKLAMEQAARQLLADLEERGHVHSRFVSRRSRHVNEVVNNSTNPNPSTSITMPTDSNSTENSFKKRRIMNESCSLETSPDPPSVDLCDPNVTMLVKVSVDMRKGGPRTSLHLLCKKLNYKMPEYQSIAEGSRFVTKMILYLPNSDAIEIKGEQRTDKKSSQDSAALLMLHELGRLQRCILEEC
ncbi:endoribonuclease Dicer homolog 3a isoform X1 [Amborella trichopoda]|nr:endoribonuclease Dicer homolog 3a isoform X1 [Amborella trichopoda]|eukprot:XP_020528007.1 endoribonuclease Dicer homolog 3a isoform X1 [Amborella trichopoda]